MAIAAQRFDGFKTDFNTAVSDFKSIKDYPHFQMKGWKNYK